MRQVDGQTDSFAVGVCIVLIETWLKKLYILPPTKDEVNVFARVCLSVYRSVC